MRFLVTGGSGLLGSDLVPALLSAGHEVESPSHAQFDVTDPLAVAQFGAGERGRFDWCINLAAFTNVDAAESERQAATELNVLAPGYLAQACAGIQCRLLHLSTDYVFGGAEGAPFTEESDPAPVQFYGQTKLDGEYAVLEQDPGAIVARVAWVYGLGKRCFPLGLFEAFAAGKTLKIVADQWGVPSYAPEVSRMLLELVTADPVPGVYHVAGADAVSRFEYAEAAAKAYAEVSGHPVTDLVPVPATEFPTVALRPTNSVISTHKVGKYAAPHLPLDECMVRLARAWFNSKSAS